MHIDVVLSENARIKRNNTVQYMKGIATYFMKMHVYHSEVNQQYNLLKTTI